MMIVDDDALVLRALGRAVKRLPVRLVTASSAEEALAQIARDGPPSILISDYQLPGMDGASLLMKVTQEHPRVRGILSSGTSKVMPAGSNIVTLPKPVELEALAALVAALTQ